MLRAMGHRGRAVLVLGATAAGVVVLATPRDARERRGFAADAARERAVGPRRPLHRAVRHPRPEDRRVRDVIVGNDGELALPAEEVSAAARASLLEIVRREI